MVSSMDHGAENPLKLTASGRQPPTVTIVGGTPAQATIAAVLVAQFGCRVRCASSGEAALTLLRSQATDLVVIDLGLPDMDGLVAIQLIRALADRRQPPVIALTSEGQQTGRLAHRLDGMCQALAKPYSPRELFAAMRSALARIEAEPTPAQSPFGQL